MRDEELGEIVLVHRLGQVRDVEVRVFVVGEGLELRVERLLRVGQRCRGTASRSKMITHPRKADFVAKVVEAADAVLGVLVVVVLDKAETGETVSRCSISIGDGELTPCTAQC